MKKIHFAIAAAAMLFLILAMLITGFQLAIYGDKEYKFYQEKYEKYHVTEDLGMEMTDVMKVTDYMMAYLIGDREELSIVTEIEGKQQDFFNEQDRAHMADVKHLFLEGLKFRTICLAACVILLSILFFMKADIRRVIPKAYTAALLVFLAVVIVLGVLFASDFTKYFTIFHELFFTNDLWIFDPETDFMIRMLPEGFFYDMVIRIGITFIGMIVILWGLLKLAGSRWNINKKGL